MTCNSDMSRTLSYSSNEDAYSLSLALLIQFSAVIWTEVLITTQRQQQEHFEPRSRKKHTFVICMSYRGNCGKSYVDILEVNQLNDF